MVDVVFEAFDRLVDVDPDSWTSLVQGETHLNGDQQAELLRMLRAWKRRPAFSIPTCALEEALDRIGHAVESDDVPEIPGFTIIRLLGRGGAASVHLAHQDAPVSRTVALKVFHRSSIRGELLRREARALARLRHPNLAVLHDVGEAPDGSPYAVLEYIEGRSIRAWCTEARPSLADVVRVFGQVCHAVSHANENGIIHRDLKPSNILVQEIDGVPVAKVLDFSIAAALSATQEETVTEERLIAGTPEYMSPEQADPTLGPCTTRSDVYSLGILLYELLAGRHPIQETREKTPSLFATLKAISAGVDVPPSRAGSDRGANGSDPRWGPKAIRGDLDAIVLKAVRPNPEDRYAS
ncbi:MAG: serine/threonine protein kinase, partial [Phycisphaerales bacterium]|nr:serine/threonine protein kinase [Phycisphaerales bacterium]